MPPDENDQSDAILVQRALQGDAAAFASLFHRHYGAVREFAFRVVLERHAADDVAQESFIRAARKLGNLRDGQAFLAWIFCIASRLARSHLRARRAHQRKLDAAAESIPDSNVSADDEPSQRALQAMQTLPPKQREAVALVILDGLSHAEAARRLDCAESTISWRILCAKRTLRHRLQPRP
jgi:RNA polymerase sigma-70 factor, ECF subfamily